MPEPLLSRRHDQHFRMNMRRGLRGLYLRVKIRVDEVCRAKKIRVCSIAIAMPAQWSLDLQDFQREFVRDIFGYNIADVISVTETEAVAHYLFKEGLEQLRVHRVIRRDDLVFFLDFGRHTMVSFF